MVEGLGGGGECGEMLTWGEMTVTGGELWGLVCLGLIEIRTFGRCCFSIDLLRWWLERAHDWLEFRFGSFSGLGLEKLEDLLLKDGDSVGSVTRRNRGCDRTNVGQGRVNGGERGRKSLSCGRGRRNVVGGGSERFN